MRSLAPFATLLVTLAAIPVVAQPEPGWGYTWETVGERPIDADALAFDGAGTLWAACPDSLRRLDLSGGPPGRWRAVPSGQTGGGAAVRALGPDTLLQAGIGVIRSTNGGQWFLPRWGPGDHALYEVPQGHPYAGRLLAGAAASTAGAGFSDDRGSTWAFATETIPATAQSAYDFAAPPPGTAPGAPGRVVAVGIGGLWLSDDGGSSWRAGPVYNLAYNGRFVRALARPAAAGGGVRMVALVNGGAGAVWTYTSEDGGTTWGRGPDLTEPPGDGLGWPSVQGLVPLGGASALALLGRGRVWRTDGGGAMWSEVAQAPRGTERITMRAAEPGRDGRLYIATGGTGLGQGWVYRTAEVLAVPVGTEPEGEGAGLRLEARPNPSGDAMSLVLTLPRGAAVQVTIYDALGREAARLYDGPLGTGTHRLPLDAAALPAGVYHARVVAEGGAATARLTLTR